MPNIFLGIFKTILTGFNPRLISQIYDLDHYESHTVAPVGDTLHNKQSLSPNTIDISEYSSSRTWSDINGTDILHQITTLFTNIESIDSIPVNGLTSNVNILIAGKLVAYATDITYFFNGGSGNELYARAVSPAFFYDDKIAVITATTEETAGQITISRWEAVYVADTAEVELIETDTVEIAITSSNAKQQITLNLDSSKCALLIGFDGYIISDIKSTTFAPTLLKSTDIPAFDAQTSPYVRDGTKTYSVDDKNKRVTKCVYILTDTCAGWSYCDLDGIHDLRTRIITDAQNQTATRDYTTGTNSGSLLAFGYDIEADTINCIVRRYGETSTAETAAITNTNTDVNFITPNLCWNDVYDEDSEIYNRTQTRDITPSSLDRIEYYQSLADGYIGNPSSGTVILQAEYAYSLDWERDYEKQDGLIVSDVTTKTFNTKTGTVTLSDVIDVSAGLFALTLSQITHVNSNRTDEIKKYIFDGKKSNLIEVYTHTNEYSDSQEHDEVQFGDLVNYSRTDAASTTPTTVDCGPEFTYNCRGYTRCPDEEEECDYTTQYTYRFDAIEGNNFSGSLGEYEETWDYI